MLLKWLEQMEADVCLHMSNINTLDLIPTFSLLKNRSLFQIIASSFIVLF